MNRPALLMFSALCALVLHGAPLLAQARDQGRRVLFQRDLAATRRGNDVALVVGQELFTLEEGYRPILANKWWENLYTRSSPPLNPAQARQQVQDRVRREWLSRGQEVVLLDAARDADMERFVAREEVDSQIDALGREADLSGWERTLAENLRTRTMTTAQARREIRDKLMVDKFIAVRTGAQGIKLLPNVPAPHDTYVSPQDLLRYYQGTRAERERANRIEFRRLRLDVPGTDDEPAVRARIESLRALSVDKGFPAAYEQLTGGKTLPDPEKEHPDRLPREAREALLRAPKGSLTKVLESRDRTGRLRALEFYQLVDRRIARFDDPEFQEELRRELWERRFRTNRLHLLYELMRDAAISSPTSSGQREFFLSSLRHEIEVENEWRTTR